MKTELVRGGGRAGEGDGREMTENFRVGRSRPCAWFPFLNRGLVDIPLHACALQQRLVAFIRDQLVAFIRDQLVAFIDMCMRNPSIHSSATNTSLPTAHSIHLFIHLYCVLPICVPTYLPTYLPIISFSFSLSLFLSLSLSLSLSLQITLVTTFSMGISRESTCQ